MGSCGFTRIGPRPCFPRPCVSYVEENLLNVNDVLQVEEPPEHHLDGQRQHGQKQERSDIEPRPTHLQVEAAEGPGSQQRWQAEIQEHQDDPEDLADQPDVRQWHGQSLDPDQLGEVDVVKRYELVRVPILVRPEEVPVGTAEKRTGDDQKRPEDEEPVEEDSELPLPLAERVVPIAARV